MMISEKAPPRWSEGGADKVRELCERIRPILAGNGPEVIGATLCDLLAVLLAGYAVSDSVEETHKLREEILTHHIECLWELVTLNAKQLGTPQ